MRSLPRPDACADALPIVDGAYSPPLYPTRRASVERCEALEDCELNDVGVRDTVWSSLLPPGDDMLGLDTDGSTDDTMLSLLDGCAQVVGSDSRCGLSSSFACDDDGGLGLNAQLVGLPVSGGTESRIKLADDDTTQGAT